MKTKYDDEELDILKSHENNPSKISETRKFDLRNAVKSAKDTIEKKAELSIKLTEKDLRNLKLKEIEIGIPYQNIVTALIHKYLEDKIDLTICYFIIRIIYLRSISLFIGAPWTTKPLN